MIIKCNNPKVSCLMVTRHRAEYVRRSIECFRCQTYENRELIVVNDSDDGTEEIVQGYGDERIVYIRCPQKHMPLGSLRNFSIDVAKGHYIMQWDDDDVYHCNRILLQLECLMESGCDACFLERLILAWPSRNLLRVSRRRLWEGSMLAMKDSIPKYFALERREDSHLVKRWAREGGRYCVLDNPDLYVYVIHGRNTCDAEHFERSVFVKSEPIAEEVRRWRLLRLVPGFSLIDHCGL